MNRKSTLIGYLDAIAYVLTILAALPYTLGEAAAVLPPDAKKWVAIIGLSAGAVLKAVKGHVSADAKPRVVEGGE